MVPKSTKKRYPVIAVLQLLKKERHDWVKNEKVLYPLPDNSNLPMNVSMERLVLEKGPCAQIDLDWFRTIKSLYGYLATRPNEEPLKTMCESLMSSAFSAKQWPDVVECFGQLQQSRVSITNMDYLKRLACISYGKLGRFDEMTRLFLDCDKVPDVVGLYLSLLPVSSGSSLRSLHNKILGDLTCGKYGSISTLSPLLDKLFDCVTTILSNEELKGQEIVKCLELLLFRTKLHSFINLFYPLPPGDIIGATLEHAGFKCVFVNSEKEDKVCRNHQCSLPFLPTFQLTQSEIDSLKVTYLQYLVKETEHAGKPQQLLQEQIHLLHQCIRRMGGSVDVVIDGLNAAYQNRLRFLNVDLGQLVVTKVHQIIHSLKLDKILILLPKEEKLLRKATFRFDLVEQYLSKKYGSNVIVHKVDPEFLDDKFVIYASLLSNAYILTNDLYRDHVDNVLKLFAQQSKLLPSFIVNRKIDSIGVVSRDNIMNRDAITVKKVSFSHISQFNVSTSISHSSSEESVPSGDVHLTIHEPTLRGNTGSEFKRVLNKQSLHSWVCAKRSFNCSAQEFDFIKNWISNNL